MKQYQAKAKINLGLKVLFRYPNGYHHIVSPVQTISFHDTLQISFSPTSEFSWQNKLPPAYAQSLTNAFLPQNLSNNLIYKAQKVLFEFFSQPQVQKEFPAVAQKIKNFSKLKIHLIKRVPSPSGLGGGSSNAAALLRFYLDQLLALGLKELSQDAQKKKLMNYFEQLSLAIGADVPFFLQGKTALFDGVGETTALNLSPFVGILGIPSFGFSTAKMYSQLKKPLQHDWLLHNSQEDLILRYRSLFEHGNANDESLVFPFVKTNGKIFLLKNDFLTIAQKVFWQEYLVVEKAMRLVAIAISQVFPQETVFVSLSGSGSAFFALVLRKETQETQETMRKMQAIVKELKEQKPAIHWLSFVR